MPVLWFDRGEVWTGRNPEVNLSRGPRLHRKNTDQEATPTPRWPMGSSRLHQNLCRRSRFAVSRRREGEAACERPPSKPYAGSSWSWLRTNHAVGIQCQRQLPRILPPPVVNGHGGPGGLHRPGPSFGTLPSAEMRLRRDLRGEIRESDEFIKNDGLFSVDPVEKSPRTSPHEPVLIKNCTLLGKSKSTFFPHAKVKAL